MESITWEYYNSHFPKLNEKRFDELFYSVKREVMKKLPKREYTIEEQTDIQDCICELINELDIHSQTNGLSSVSNDGFSKSFVARTPEEKKQSINSIIEKWVGYMIPKFIGY